MAEDKLSLDEMIQIGKKVEVWKKGQERGVDYFSVFHGVKINLYRDDHNHRDGVDFEYKIEAKSIIEDLNSRSLGHSSVNDSDEENSELEIFYKDVRKSYEERQEFLREFAMTKARELLD